MAEVAKPPTSLYRHIQQYNYEAWADEFNAARTQGDWQKVHKALMELRDFVEVVQQHEYDKFLRFIVPPFFQLLKEGQIPSPSDSLENRSRNLVLEIFSRLPFNEGMRPHSKPLLKLLLQLLHVENEDNGLICLRVIVELHKVYRQHLEAEVQPFIDFAALMFGKLPQIVKTTFSQPAEPLAASLGSSGAVSAQGGPGTPGAPAGTDKKPQAIVLAVNSFKVVAECPMTTVMLFQLFPMYYQKTIERLVNPALMALAEVAPPHAQTSHRAAYIELINAQTKTLSFLAFVIRQSQAQQIKRFEAVPKTVLQLLQNCPPESTSTRKDILLAVRHILTTELKKAFVPFMDQLLDEQILIGTTRAAQESLRPLVYTLVGDLIHNVRADLNLTQITRIIHMFSRNLHDSSLSYAIHTMCAKLLYGLIDPLVRFVRQAQQHQQHQMNAQQQQGQQPVTQLPPHPVTIKCRDLSFKIMDAYAAKLSGLKHRVPKLLAEDKDQVEHGLATLDTPATDTAKECRTLLKTLVIGFKNIVWAHLSIVKRLAYDEVQLMSKVFRDGLRCLAIYRMDADDGQVKPEQVEAATSPAMEALWKERKEVLDAFTGVFTMLDSSLPDVPQNFLDIMTVNLNYFYEQCIEAPLLLNVAQTFAQYAPTPAIAKTFTDLLLNFLIDNMANLAGEKKEGAVLLKLFKVAFAATSLLPDLESILSPHLPNIITQAMRLSSETKEPTNYFLLIKSLFRSVQGRNEIFTKEFLPLVQGFLEGLNRLQVSAHSPQLRELFIELSLTVPVRTSAMLPHLRSLMKPLVLCIESGVESLEYHSSRAMLGIRLLETFIDKMSPEFLDPVLAEWKPRLLRALWRHLRPPPYMLAPHILRILGKLSGRNRDFFNAAPQLTTNEQIEQGLVISVAIDPTHTVDLPISDAVNAARKCLLAAPPAQPPVTSQPAPAGATSLSLFNARQLHAYNFLKACVVSMLDISSTTGGKFDVSDTISEVDAQRPLKVDLSVDGIVYTKSVKQLEAEIATFKACVSSVLLASKLESCKDVAAPFFEFLASHFAHLLVSQRPVDSSKLLELDPATFIDALVDVLCSENREHAAAGTQVLDVFVATATQLASGFGYELCDLPVCDQLSVQLASCCYKREWFQKAGGCLGIAYLTEKLPGTWVQKHALAFLKALLFILKDLSASVSVGTVEDAQTTATRVLKVLFAKSDDVMQVDGAASLSETQTDAALFMALQLHSSNSSVRKAAQAAVTQISELTGLSIPSLLTPFKEQLFGPILSQPIRKLSTKVQTGYLEALAFGLNTTPPLIGLTDELKKLVLDIIPIAEQEEQINRPKANHANRLAVLELLASLHAHPDTHTPEHEDLRARAMGVFFKGLTSRNKPTVQVARKGIINFTAQSAVPKDVLQASLRPILLNLADFRKLNEPLLDSLCRLLALLNKCFTATLSKALYDHLQRWLSPTTMAASKQWKAGEEIKIATGILETFHLLPTAVGVPPTVEQLVDVVLRLESLLSTYGTRKAVPRDLTSPFRDPLAKYLSRCAPEAVTFFLDKLGAEPHTRLFKSILRNEHSGGLREELTRNLDKLLAATLLTTKTNDERIAPYIHGVQIIRSLVKFNPAWLDENESALKAVLGLWNSQDRKDLVAREANLTVFQTKLSRLLVKCLLTYVRAHPEKPEILFDLLAVFNEVSATDYTFLEEFFATDLPVKFPVQYKRAIINLFIDLFPKADYSPEHKVQALKVLIIPMLTHCFEVKEDVLDNETISRLVKGVYIGEGVADYSAALNVELLKLATLLVKARKDETVEHRKDLIKLAWIRMKADDPAKHTAYVLTCHLIAYHDTPAKVVLQIFVTLLRAYQQETKALVREALDVLTPALRLRLPNRPDEHPVWVKWMKKLLAEESHQLPQLVHMLQLIVRIPDPFFPYRGQLIPYMVNALNRIGLTSGTPLEQRKLSLSLVELMVSWEQKKNEAPTAEPASSEVGPTSPLTQGDSMDVDVKPTGGSEGNLAQSTEQPVQQPQIMEFRMNPQMMDIVVSFLVRVASGAADTAQRDQTQAASSGVILHAALRILREALAVWPAAQVKPQFLEKLLAPVTDSPPIVVVGLQILDIVLENDTFLPNGIPLLEAAFLPSQNDPTKIGVIASDNPKITEALCPVLSKILRKYPLGPESPVDNMFTKICEILTGSLLAEKSNSENATTIIKAISEQAPNYFRPAAPALMKYCIRLIRDYTKPDAPADPQGANSAQKKAQRAQATVIFSIISLLGSQLAALADMKHQNGQPVETKKQLMLAVVHLLEKSSDEHLFMNLIKLLKDWMSQPDALTAKDKNAFLGKMRRFEKVGQPRALPLHAEYYDMVYSLYTSETTNFAEMPMLETTALAALCSRDTATRHRFLELFRRRLSTDLPDRLVQLLSHSTWENLPYLFWIQPALDCLLAMVPEDHGLNLSSHSALVPKLAPASGSDPGMPDLQQVEALRSMRIKDLITPLREVLFNEQDLSMQQWTSMFVALWDTSLTRPERLRIHESLSTLLSHDSINKQARVQPNVVQALMHSFCHLKVNKIQLPVAVLKYLGTSFNSWHATISLLEEHLGSRRPEQVSAALSALGDLYKRLGEDDYHIGILTHQAQINDTRAGLVLEQHGMWPRAQEVYYQALRHAQIGVLPDVPPKEHDIWESHWIECSKRLSQWELLQDYAKHNQQPELLAESSWKLGDWSQLKEAFTKFAYSNDSYKVKIFQSFVFLQDVKIHEVDTLCKSAMQFLVAQWVSLPRIPSAAYTGFLHAFQQIIELYESAKIVKDINGATRHAKLTEIKNGILKSWRERLPCETDDMTLWSDILQWRQHVYSMINNAIPPTDSSFLGFHETAWSINKLARVARKQGLFEMCINSLAKIYQLPNIDLQEAFAKLREQIKCFTGLPAYYRTAVDIINSTNLEFFNAQQRAEFFQLKGDFLQRLGSYEEATTAFSTSVLLFDNLAKGWIGWAKFHDDRFRIAVSTGDHKSALVSANHAVSCYLQGVKSSQVPSSRKHLGRVLWLLSFDGEAPEGSDVASSLPTDDEAATPSAETKVDASQETKDVEMSEADSFFVGEGSGENTNNAKRDANFEKPPPPNAKRPKSEETEDGNERHEVKATAPGADAPASSPESELEAELAPFKKRLLSNSFVQHVKNVPQWVWWPWIPQLLHALHRVEGPVMKWLLVRLAQSYPHAVFPHLSLFQKEQRAYDRMVQGDKNLPFPLKASQQILDTMRTKWPNIVSDLEKIAEEVDIISQLSAEEVLQEDLQLIMKAVLDGTPTDINEHLARINRTSVRELSSAAMKKEFERDLINHQSVTHPPYLVSTLRTWLKRLRTTITNTPGSIDLERRSMFLAEFQNDSFTEIPGQYAEGREATSEHHINIERFESPVRVIRSGHGPRRMLSLRGTNGKVYTYFIDRASETSLLLDPEQVELGTQTSVLDWSRQYRFADSLRVVNRVWTKAPQTRRRGLQISAPVFQPLSPRLRLIAADTDSVPLQVIFEEWADTQRNVSADLSAHAHEQLFQQSSRLAAQIFEYCCNASPDTILVDYFGRKITESFESLWQFKKHFIMQLAGLSAVQFVFGIRSVGSSEFFVSTESSSIYLHNASHRDLFAKEESTGVPFRLSRNLQRVVGPLCHAGQFDATLSAALFALASDKSTDILADHLRLSLRDDILESLVAANEEAQVPNIPPTVEPLVQRVVARVKATVPTHAQPSPIPSQEVSIIPLNTHITDLINAAVSEDNLVVARISANYWM